MGRMVGPWRFETSWASRRAICSALRQRLGALCLLVLFVAASVSAGKAYLWCVPMQQAMHDCCCAAAHGTDQDLRLGELPAVHEPCCCTSHLVGELPATHVPPPVDSVPPALATFVVVPECLVEPPRLLAQRLTSLPPRLQRYGPTRAGPRSASATCAALQVFRC